MLRLHAIRQVPTGEVCGRCGRVVQGKWMDANAYISGVYTGVVTRCEECWNQEVATGNTAEDMPHYRVSQTQAKQLPPTPTTPEPPHRPPGLRPTE